MRHDKHLNRVMSLGLVPIMAFLITSVFINEVISLYILTVISLLFYIYKIKKATLLSPGIVLFNSVIALSVCSIAYIFAGKSIIPSNSLSVIVVTLTFFLSCTYIIFPKLYKSINNIYYNKTSILNHWSCQLIAVASVIYIILSSIFIISNPRINAFHYHTLFNIFPTILYAFCIFINYKIVKTIHDPLSRIPLIRVLILCDGKVFVSKKRRHKFFPNKYDTPIEDFVSKFEENHDEMVKDMIVDSKMTNIERNELDPRFNLKYIIDYKGKKQLVLLYVLPISNQKEVIYKNGIFVTPEEIEKNMEQYSKYIDNELPHISMAASLWNDFK